MTAEKRYFIYVYHQLGNIGRYEFILIDEQPKDGFDSEFLAENHLEYLIKKGEGHWFDRDWHKYVVMKTFVPKKK